VCGVDLSLLLTGGRNVSLVWSSFIRRLGRGSGRAQVALRLKQRLLRVVGEKGNTASRYSHSVLGCFKKPNCIFVGRVVLNRLYNKTEIRKYHTKLVPVADKQLTGHLRVHRPLYHSRPYECLWEFRLSPG
jgi:hypothetical protein